MDEMSIHNVKIKSEIRDPDLDTDIFKEEETSYPENKINISEPDNGNGDIEDDKPLKRKKRKKKSMKFVPPAHWEKDVPEPPAGLVDNYYDLDLSVEFLSQLFEYVNELCEHINNGDSNINR